MQVTRTGRLETCAKGHTIEWTDRSRAGGWLHGECPCATWVYLVHEDTTLLVVFSDDECHLSIDGLDQ